MGILNSSKNKIGAKKLPANASEHAIHPASGLNVPQNKESPIPANGPIKLAFTALIELISNSSLFAFSSSIAATTPKINGSTIGVELKNSECLFNASANFSFSG